jgi:hypothetical protein
MSMQHRVLQGLGWAEVGDAHLEETTTTVTCPDPTPGSVTNLTGTVKGVSPAFADAYSYGYDPAATYHYQWQYWALAVGGPNGCARFRQNKWYPSEQAVNAILIGSRDPMDLGDCPLPPAPFSVPVRSYGQHDPASILRLDDTGQPDPNGQNIYVAEVNWVPRSANCGPPRDYYATGGTITYTTLAADRLAGQLEVQFGDGQLTYSFDAPNCLLVGCPPRPSKASCV